MSEVEAPRARRGVLGVVRQGQTYRNILYLLTAFPVTLLYWILLNEGLGLGGSAAPIGLLLFLVLVLAISWGLAYVERLWATWVLGIQFAPMEVPAQEGETVWERVREHLRNPVTWKALVYLLVRIPFGALALAVAIAVLALPLALILAPAGYLAAVTLYMNNASHIPATVLSTPWGSLTLGQIFGQVTPSALTLSLLATALGFFMLLEALRVQNGLAWLWGQFAHATLGLSERDAWLAEARALAARESARAEVAERDRRELILNASHELRTPIASIRAHIESLLILESETLPEKVRSFLAITQREAERLGTLVEDLLMLAHADADGLRLQIQPLAIGEVVEEVYQALEPLAEREREVTLVRTVAPDLPPALADRERLAQVLFNLVRNAIAYTPAGGVVSIELAPGEVGHLALTVTDTGIGIPPEEIDRVFDRFYRTDASRTRDTGGFGLGLAIVRDLVQGMGGSVVAERVPEGGSRFRVTLRAAQVVANA